MQRDTRAELDINLFSVQNQSIVTLTRTYQFRIWPSRDQIEAFEHWLDLTRNLYNAALEQRREVYRNRGKSLSYFDQSREIKILRRELPEYAGVNSQLLHSVLQRLDRAFRAFFRRIKAGEKPGYPRFKSYRRWDSLAFKDNGWKYDGGKASLKVTNIGWLRVMAYRELPCKPKRITITRKADGWYASFICTEVEIVPLPATGRKIGIDLGLSNLVTTSDGKIMGDIGPAVRAERRLRRAQKALSRKKKGSRRREKARQILARRWLDLTRARKAQLDIISRRLVDECDVIVLEDLNIQGMLAGGFRGLRRNIGLASWGELQRMITYKAEEAGRRAVLCNPRGTSQECCRCGTVVPKDLNVRVHDCPACGLVLDRDRNAAINILHRGLRLLRGGDELSSPLKREDRVESAVCAS